MESENYDPPSDGEIEVSLFGPGYGESILIHLPHGKWIVVDSCKHPNSKRPVAFHYFEQLGVKWETDVELLIATHWHDDHIRGLGTLFNSFEQARLVISGALMCDEFAKLIATYRRGAMMESSGVDEFREVFRVLEERRRNAATNYKPCILASEDKLIFRDNTDGVKVNVWSLSPSSMAQLNATVSFAKVLPSIDGHRLRVPSQRPNNTSVVVWAEVNDRKLLFGADLEKTSSPDTGWTAILEHTTAVSGKAEVFKIPHHGSENAHHHRVWDELLAQEPLSGATPFRLGATALPSKEDVNRINAKTNQAYLTAPPRKKQPRWHRRVVGDMIEQATTYMESIQFGWGHIRFRSMVDDTSKRWNVDLFGDARHLA